MSSGSNPVVADPLGNTDGRAQRSERSRQALLDALCALVEQGNLSPTAQQVACQAGVGVRTLFRHFADMEALLTALDAMLWQRASLLADGDRSGDLAARIAGLVATRAAWYENVGAMMLSGRSTMWRSKVVRQHYLDTQDELRRDLHDWLPELAGCPATQQATVEVVSSFDTWHRLRSVQGLDISTSKAVLMDLLNTHLP